MSETQAAYLAVKCPKCGRCVGDYKKMGDQIWLSVGALTCRTIRAVCECGAEFDFDSSQKQLEMLIERSRRLNNML